VILSFVERSLSPTVNERALQVSSHAERLYSPVNIYLRVKE
jgi:hypothetical protein